MADTFQRLLFVDDDVLVLRGLKRSLGPRSGMWRMDFAESGADALRLMANERFDAVVTDMRMPGMDGAELLDRVMRAHPATIRIALSGYADRDVVLRCVGTAHQYLAKPCDAGTIEMVLRRLGELARRERIDDVSRLVSKCSILPSLPSVYSKLVERLNDPECRVEEIGAVVAEDAVMSAHMLKLVNSAFFGLGRLVAGTDEAVLMLGVDTIKSLVLGAGVFDSGGHDLPAGFSAGQLWSHCQACADAAKFVATRLGLDRAQANEAFVAGLLHDFGKLLLAANFPDDYGRALAMAETESVALSSAERLVFGADHAEVGGYFLGLWGLPVETVDAIAAHHHPAGAANPESLVLAAVHIGNHLATRRQPAVAGLISGRIDRGFMATQALEDTLEDCRREWSMRLATEDGGGI